MKVAKTVFLVIGLGLLGLIVYQTDLAEVWARLREVGIGGIAVVLVLYLLAFICDTLSWQLTLPSARLDPTWLYRLWKVQMVGAAFNRVTPLASLGGEPIKAVILKRHYGVGYREATASLVLVRTVYCIALVLFLCLGFAIMIADDTLPPRYEWIASVGLAVLSAGIVLFFLVQRYKMVTRARDLLGDGWLRSRTETASRVIGDVEDRVVAFYTTDRTRFAAAILFAMGNWVIGVVEVYYAMVFLGHPVSFADAWVIEAIAVLVRSALFVVPANIGSQEGTFVLIVGAVTGSAALGLALGVLTRVREIVWILWGFAIGSTFPAVRRPATASATNADRA